MKFKVTVEETLSREIDIEAKDVESALTAARYMYAVENIVLDSDDFVSVEFHAEKYEEKGE